MLSYKCRLNGCDFEITDAQHVDDVVQQLHVHYRAQHPTKAFYPNHHLEAVEQYNMDLNDWLVRNYGEGYEGRYQPRQLYTVVEQLTLQNNRRYYSAAVIAEAQAWIADYNQQNGIQDDAVVEVDERAVPPAGFVDFIAGDDGPGF